MKVGDDTWDVGYQAGGGTGALLTDRNLNNATKVVSKQTRGLGCVGAVGAVALTVFSWCTITLIGCGSNSCFNSNIDNGAQEWCDTTCSSGLIAGEVISGIALVALCCGACILKNS